MTYVETIITDFADYMEQPQVDTDQEFERFLSRKMHRLDRSLTAAFRNLEAAGE